MMSSYPATIVIGMLNDDKGYYLGGEEIRAEVTIFVHERTQAKGIIVEMLGRNEAEFHTTSDDGFKETLVSGSETHIKEKFYLSPFDGNTIIEPGMYSHEVSHVLPKCLPPSFEGAFGFVRYSLTGGFDGGLSIDRKAMCTFKVECPVDLNKIERPLRQPTRMQKTKMLYSLCCATGMISVDFWLDKQGYAHGESIILNAEIENMSNRLIEGSNVILKQCVVYNHKHHKTISVNDKCRVQRGPVEPFGRDEWTGVRLLVPRIASSFLPYSKFIDINYFVQLQVLISQKKKPFTISLEVTIGDIPLTMEDNPQTSTAVINTPTTYPYSDPSTK